MAEVAGSSCYCRSRDTAPGTIARICLSLSKSAFRKHARGLLLAYDEFDSGKIIRSFGNNSGQNVILSKRGKKTWRIHGVRTKTRRAFPRRITGADSDRNAVLFSGA